MNNLKQILSSEWITSLPLSERCPYRAAPWRRLLQGGAIYRTSTPPVSFTSSAIFSSTTAVTHRNPCPAHTVPNPGNPQPDGHLPHPGIIEADLSP